MIFKGTESLLGVCVLHPEGESTLYTGSMLPVTLPNSYLAEALRDTIVKYGIAHGPVCDFLSEYPNFEVVIAESEDDAA